MNIDISLKKVYNMVDLIKQIEPIFFLKKLKISSINLNIDIDVKFVNPGYLTLIVAACNWAKENGIIIEYNINNDSRNYYPYRINFFKLLGAKVYEPFYRRFSNNGRFIEITPLPFDNMKKIMIDTNVIDEIIRIIKNNYKIESSIYTSLNYCLWEQVDNIANHSSIKGTGYTVAQHYPTNKKILLCVVDTGIGVYEALTNSPGTKYKSLTYKEAISDCIKEKVTNGKGMGNGLYHSAKFIQANKGDFVLYSGNYYIEIGNGVIRETKRGPYWHGTIIFEKICTDVSVDFSETFDNCDIPTSVLECDDILDGLWEN